MPKERPERQPPSARQRVDERVAEVTDALDLTAAECMTRNPATIGGNEFAATALAMMEEKKITSLVVADKSRKVQGIVHLHDLWGTEMM